MVSVFRRIGAKLYFMLGLDHLLPPFRRFMLVHISFLLTTGVTSTFVNTLLMRSSDDSNIALKYSIWQYIFIAVGMILAAWMLHRVVNRRVILLALSFAMLTYLLILTCMPVIHLVYPLIGIACGLSNGFYWLTYFDALALYCTDETRDLGINLIGLFAGVISLVMPLSCGLLIDAMPGLLGYYLMFGFCFLAAILSLYFSTRLEPDFPDRQRSPFFRIFKKAYTEKIWFFTFHSDLLRGLRDGAFGFFLNVLLFSLVENEVLIGFNSFLCGGCSMLSSLLASRLVRPHNRMRWMAISALLSTGTVLLLFFSLTPLTVILLSVVNALLAVYLQNPVSTTLFTAMDVMPEGRNCKREIVSTTETFKDLGRVLGVLLIMAMPAGYQYALISLSAISIVQLCTMLFCRLALRCAEEKRKERTDA